MSYAEMKEYLSKAAMIFCMENMQHHYDSFFEYIMGETDERWLIGIYVAEAIERNGVDDGLHSLASVMYRTFDHDILYEHHLEDAQKFLREIYKEQEDILALIANLFDIYTRVKIVKDYYFKKMDPSNKIVERVRYPQTDEEKKSCDEKVETITKIVGDNQYAADWPDM